MWRMRRVRLVVLLSVAIGAGGGYWLLTRDPDPVLRTVTLAAAEPRFASLDEGLGRLYIQSNDSSHTLVAVDTRTGAPVPLGDALGQATGLPSVDHQSGHLFTVGAQLDQYLMIDIRTNALIKAIPIPGQGGFMGETFDGQRDRDLLTFLDTPVLLAIDARTGRILRTVPSCESSAAPALSRSTQRLFEFCQDGRVLIFDSASYRQVASLSAPAFGASSINPARVDEATQRLFVLGDRGFGVLDAGNGALLRTLPIIPYWSDSEDILPGTGEFVTGLYADPSLRRPPRAVAVLDGRTGAILHRWPVPANPVAVLANPLTGHVLVASAGPWDDSGEPDGYGTLSVLDPRTGRILRQVETGVLPAWLAADRATRHLFVVNFTSTKDGQGVSRSYPDGWWPQTLRRIKSMFGWLPFKAPDPPPPPVYATVMMLDLTKL